MQISYLQNHNEIVFRRISAIKEGDIAYIYVTSPYSQIKYKCHVTNDNVSEDELKNHLYAIPQKDVGQRKLRFIKLHLDYVFEEDLLKLTDLKKYGLGQVQIQARTDRRVQAYIWDVEKELGIGNTSWLN